MFCLQVLWVRIPCIAHPLRQRQGATAFSRDLIYKSPEWSSVLTLLPAVEPFWFVRAW